MKKLGFILLLLLALQLNSFAYEYQSGDDILKKIDNAYLKANPKKMEKLWNEFCSIYYDRCLENQGVFEKKLYEAKVEREQIKRARMQNIAVGLAAGAAGGASSYTPYQQSYYTINRDGNFVGPGIYNPPKYNIYNSYGQNIGRITPY